MNRPRLLVLFFAVVLAAACTQAPRQDVESCTLPAAEGTTCSIFTDLPPSYPEYMRQSCADAGGTVGTGCPSHGLVGCCSYTEFSSASVQETTETDCYYFDAGAEGADAAEYCGLGTWTTSLP